MQVIESEIVIPFEYKSLIKRSLIFSCAMLVFVVGLFLFLILLASQMAAKASVTFGDSSALAEKWTHQWITLEVWGIVILVLVLLLYSVLITSLIRKLRYSSPFLRINHEGIFMSMGAFLLRWEEIKEFTPLQLEKLLEALSSCRPVIGFHAADSNRYVGTAAQGNNANGDASTEQSLRGEGNVGTE